MTLTQRIELPAGGPLAGRNQLIDGWRGLSVLFVIIGHLISRRYADTVGALPFRQLFATESVSAWDIAQQVAFRLASPLPGTGVKIFFIISGYLITSLLLRELTDNGRLNLPAFYIRRSFRILPAFFVYLTTLFVLRNFGVIDLPTIAFFNSAFFLCNIPGVDCTWWLGHTWSLSVEEQFYLIWPFLFGLFAIRRLSALFLVVPSLLIASAFWPFAAGFACIGVGCLYALSPVARAKIDGLGTTTIILAITAFLFVQPFFAASPAIVLAVFAMVEPVLLAIVFFATLRSIGPFVWLIGQRWLARIGVFSYSLYLWQQISTGAPVLHGYHPILSFPLFFIAPALVAYFLIEAPLVKVGRRLSRALMAVPQPVHAASG